jgi:L-glyceraldehyde 3-phosphate reductase
MRARSVVRLSVTPSTKYVERARQLDAIAKRRGQTLAQMALAWTLRDKRVTSALIGASRPEQIADSVKALENLTFTVEELKEIDRHAVESGVILWRQSAELGASPHPAQAGT